MPTPPLSDRDALEAFTASQEHGGDTAAAKALGMSRCTLQHRRNVAIQRGLHLDPGIQEAMRSTGLSAGSATHGWRRVKDPETGSFNSVFWKAPPEDAEEYLERVREKFENLTPAPAIAAPTALAEDRVNLIPHSDWHFGSAVSADKAGAAYNRDIAISRMKEGFSECYAGLPAAKTAIILNNGDMTHANDDSDQTVRSKHKLKVEGSHHDNIGLCIDATDWQIQMALQKHDEVIFASNPGNHDPNTPAPILYAMRERYRDNPRVTVECRENDFFVFQRGQVFLLAHHGHGLKPAKMAEHIPYKFKREFSAAQYHYFFTGHFHSEESKTFGGLRWFQLPALTRIDQHGAELGFADTGGMAAFSFNLNTGLKNHFTVRL